MALVGSQFGGVEGARAAQEHAGAGDDNGRGTVEEALALFRSADGARGAVGGEEGVALAGDLALQAGWGGGGMGLVDAADGAHEAVHPDGRAKATVPAGLVEDEQHLLGAAEGEGGDEAVAAPGQDSLDLEEEPLLFSGAGAMEAIAVGTLQDEQVDPAAGGHGGTDGALGGERDIAAEQDRALRGLQERHGRAQDVAGGEEGKLPAGAAVGRQEGVGLTEGKGPEALQQSRDGGPTVGGQIAAGVGAGLADAHGILKHHGHERGGGGGGEEGHDWEGACDEGKGADVVGVGMGDNDGIDAAEVLEPAEVGQGIGGAGADAGIDQDAPAGGFDEEAAGADLRTAPQDMHLHDHSSAAALREHRSM